jgi:hypothetical protein
MTRLETPPKSRRKGWLVAGRAAKGLLLIPLLAPLVWSLYRTAIPWPRADTAAASAYVLAVRGGEDPVIANHWEYDYYFRRLGAAYQPLDGREFLEPQGGRVWLVVTGQTAQQRSEIVRGFLEKRWQVATQREFIRTSVVLLERQPSGGVRRGN